tara:strand:+ start:315 stop:434 length:120 start_codon:yes stop_codon:yes gene_type:complete
MSDNKPCKCNGKLYQMGYIGRVLCLECDAPSWPKGDEEE